MVQYQYENRNVTMGLLVDEVLEVLSVEPNQIEPPPTFASGSVGLGFILGVAMVDTRLIFLLDIGNVLSQNNSQGDNN